MLSLRRFPAYPLLSLSLVVLTGTAVAQGGAWSDQFDRPGLLGRVFAISDYGTDLVAGGLAIEADGQEFGNVARFDGQHWLPMGQGIHGFVVEDFALYQGELVAAGSFDVADGASVKSIASWNGAAWRPLGGGIGLSYATVGTVYALAVYQNELYAAGVFDRADNVVVANVARWDGTQWRAVGSGFNGDVYALKAGADGKLYAGGAFGTAGGTNAANIAAWDGTSWSAVGPGIGVPFNSPVRALEWHASKLWAGGYFDLPGGALYEKLASWDGSTWQAAGSFPDSAIGTQVYALQSLGTDLYVGGSIVSVDGVQVDRIARLSGSVWNSIGGVRGYSQTTVVLDLAVHAGQLVVGGNFTNAGLTFAPGAPVVSLSIAGFDGTNWKQIGKGLGFNEPVSAGMLWNGGLVVVGSFDEAGRSIAPFIAFYDGTDWTPLGVLDGPAYDLTVFQNELVVAGAFTSVDGFSMPGVAAFNGTSWHGFGTGGFGSGYGGQTVAVYQNQLYAGTIGGVKRWNGISWETFAPQIFGSVGDLHVHNNVLYIAGIFTVMGGNIASWDGTTQQIVGGGMNDYVDTLTSFGGDLVAGGIFTHAGGVAANRLARWNGSSWSAIPGITGQEVTKLTVFRGELHASGNPLLASGGAYQYIARWDGAQWHALGGAGISGPAAALIGDDATGKLYAGGSFQDADGRPSWNFALWDTAGGAVVPFCAGDGSATPCPCSNSGAVGHGCSHSLNPSGALLTASGTPSMSNDTLVLVGNGMPNSSVLYFQGSTQHNGGLGAVFGDGLRCAGGAVIRLATKVNSNGASQYPAAGDPPVGVRGGVPAAGGTRAYQAWYRNADPAYCTASTFNLTNGLWVSWSP